MRLDLTDMIERSAAPDQSREGKFWGLSWIIRPRPAGSDKGNRLGAYCTAVSTKGSDLRLTLE
jgi:hypothetical protein